MTEHGTAGGHAGPTDDGSVSIPFVVLASVLVGLGITGLAYWLITFQWILLASVVPLAGGGLLFFTRATGPDHA